MREEIGRRKRGQSMASVAAPEVGVSDALAKRPMRRDEPMRFVAKCLATKLFIA